ncbi:MAG: T9SS type A sorting domain-containing protein [Ignavibacteria bacterium]|nr:T9SS type A sorting domain-containing protein [Ignavibacteria bacterium]
MKKIFRVALGITAIFTLLLSIQSVSNAQVYGDFDTVRLIRNVPYEPLEDGIEIPPSAFGLPPMWLQDLDDGYSYPTGIDIGFPFEFAGEIFTKLWVCVNGFVTFSLPPYVPAKDPTALFDVNPSYPKNVLAPFWGDHVYRTYQEQVMNQYKQTKIHYKSDPDRGIFIVEWRFLNVNDRNIKSSIATFQLRLYKSQDPFSAQGEIEFAYGQIGGNEFTTDTRVVTRNASVGVKGDFSPADFINGLEFEKDPYIARTSKRLTNEWTPSGGTDRRIRFRALTRYNVEEFWGDGDVDLSKGWARKHYNMPQSRYVTVTDARIIMRSIATGIPLDSVRRRAAYHGDVNHNGRYYYDQFGVRKDIRWRNKYFGDSLPAEIGSLKQIFFRANEYDAALILHYISGRLPELPWLYDTIPQYGRIGTIELADKVIFKEPELTNDGYRIPIYLNGTVNGPISLFIEMDNSFELESNVNGLLVENFNNRGVFAGSISFDDSEPIGYIKLRDNLNHLNFKEIRFNDNIQIPHFVLTTTRNADDFLSIVDNFSSSPKILLTLNQIGNYQLEIADNTGKILANRNYAVETVSQFAIELNSLLGDSDLSNGVYFVRLISNGTSVVKKLVIVK